MPQPPEPPRPPQSFGSPQSFPSEDQRGARRAVSFLYLRQWLGGIGTALPFVLIIGHAFLRSVLARPVAWRGWNLQYSMSAYYYTNMSTVFVGALCAIGAFLFAYQGYDETAARAGTLAGFCAVGVGLFPASPPHGGRTIIGDFHVGFAAVLYLTLAYFAIAIFTRKEDTPGRRHDLRNTLYRICGFVIIACLALIAINEMTHARVIFASYHPDLWLESGATVAFGISWLTKGQKILTDANPSC